MFTASSNVSGALILSYVSPIPSNEIVNQSSPISISFSNFPSSNVPPCVNVETSLIPCVFAYSIISKAFGFRNGSPLKLILIEKTPFLPHSSTIFLNRSNSIKPNPATFLNSSVVV